MLRRVLGPSLLRAARLAPSLLRVAQLVPRVQAATPMRSIGAFAAAAAAAASAAAATVASAESKPEAIDTQSVTLPDGRQFAYAILGDPDGVPVFAFHGMGSSHLTWATESAFSEVAPGIKLIAVDRPGYGDSTNPPPLYSYAQFVDDLAHLADSLGIQKFCVAGHSSGGPYALAAAALLPGCVP